MLILGCVTVIFFLVFVVYKFQKKESQLFLHFQSIIPYLFKDLDINESVLFLELVRQLTLSLITLQKSNNLYKNEIQKITHTLLGFVLNIPRLEEDPGRDMLQKAIRQIDSINTSTTEIKNYLHTILPSLQKYLKHY